MIKSGLKKMILVIVLKITPLELEIPTQAETLIYWTCVVNFRSTVSAA